MLNYLQADGHVIIDSDICSCFFDTLFLIFCSLQANAHFNQQWMNCITIPEFFHVCLQIFTWLQVI